jgi:hypothetical protein
VIIRAPLYDLVDVTRTKDVLTVEGECYVTANQLGLMVVFIELVVENMTENLLAVFTLPIVFFDCHYNAF